MIKSQWKRLEAKDAHVTYTRVINDMYYEVKTRIKVMRGDSKHFQVLMKYLKTV